MSVRGLVRAAGGRCGAGAGCAEPHHRLAHLLSRLLLMLAEDGSDVTSEGSCGLGRLGETVGVLASRLGARGQMFLGAAVVRLLPCSFLPCQPGHFLRADCAGLRGCSAPEVRRGGPGAERATRRAVVSPYSILRFWSSAKAGCHRMRQSARLGKHAAQARAYSLGVDIPSLRLQLAV